MKDVINHYHKIHQTITNYDKNVEMACKIQARGKADIKTRLKRVL